MEISEKYVYKKEVDWSLLNDGLTLPARDLEIFGRYMNRLLDRGESRNIHVNFLGRFYEARIVNVNFADNQNRKKDTLQIRYSYNSELAKALKIHFKNSYNYLKIGRELRVSDKRGRLRLLDENKEYIVIFASESEDTYLFEPVIAEDISKLKDIVDGRQELLFETGLIDEFAGIYLSEQIVKIRKLNRRIGNTLKHLYDNKCQICGTKVGVEYNSNIIEAHHIDYFVKSLNNNYDNQLIICPNHHRIIHDTNAIFDKKQLKYTYPNGYIEGLALNFHLNGHL